MITINKKMLGIFMALTGLFTAMGVYILVTEKYSLLIILPCIVFTGGIIYCARSFYDNIFLFCFFMCFFTFLLGGQIINRFYRVYGYNFSDEIEMHADFVLLISLIGLLIGYITTNMFSKTNRKTNSKEAVISYNTGYIKNIRYISKIFFYGTYLLWMITLIDTIIFVIKYGYTSYYISYVSRVPAVIRAIGYMAPMAFFIFLATMPSKKNAKMPIILYILYSILSLGTGRRIHFMVGLIFIFAYAMFRNVVCPEREPWISKKAIIRLCIVVPALLMFMYMFEYIRSEYSVGDYSQYSPLIGFFIRQGTSVNVIKYTRLFENRLNPDAYYSLYNTIQWIQQSVLGNIFDLDLAFEFGKQSRNTALYGTYLADFVSYNANASIYLAGMGYGSCYIEELYVDFGYVGVFLGNVFYGCLLCKLLKSASVRRNIWLTAIGFFMVNELFKSPRATFDACFGRLLYISNWGPIVLIFVFVSLYQKRNRWNKNQADVGN